MTHVTPNVIEPVTMAGKIEDKSDTNKNHRRDTCLNDIGLPFKIARPLVISMSLFGLLHLSGKERRWAPITKIYSTIVLLVLWTTFFRSFTLYGTEGFGAVLILKIEFQGLFFQCAFVATSTYMACRKQNKFVGFLTRWSELLKTNHGNYQAFDEGSIDQYARKVKFRIYSCLFFSWLGMLLSCGLMGYFMLMADYFDFVLSPMRPSHPQALLLKCILCVVLVYVCAAVAFPLCLMHSIGYVIYEEFRVFHVDFEKAVHQNGDLPDLRNYRKRHQDICLLLENADDILSGFSGVSIVVSTVNEMLVLYNMIWYSGYHTDIAVLMSNIFWFLSGLIYLGIIAVGGGHLNHMVHTPLRTIHNIQLKTVSTEILTQITMFLTKLTGESIGLTAMGMFVIDKPTILTISGVFLTYFIVPVQFQ